MRSCELTESVAGVFLPTLTNMISVETLVGSLYFAYNYRLKKTVQFMTIFVNF